MLARLIALAAACFASALVVLVLAGTAPALKIGLSTNAQGTWPDIAQELDRVPPGTRWLREDLLWSAAEPRDDEWDWARYDSLFEEAAARGIRVLPVLGSSPRWAGLRGSWNPLDHMPAAPDERLEFAEFAARVAERYGPGGSFWEAHPEIARFAPRELELWNEPYIAVSAGGPPDGGAYAELVRASAGAMRAANPNVRVGLAADWAPEGDPYDRTGFIGDMFARVPDLGAYYDFVSVHPYTDGSPPREVDGGFGFPRIAWVRALLRAHGGAEVPFWITEIGWSTCDPVADDSTCVSEETQAANLAEAIELAGSPAYGYVDALIVYRRNDFASPNGPKEGAFGIERLDGSPKPALDVFAGALGG